MSVLCYPLGVEHCGCHVLRKQLLLVVALRRRDLLVHQLLGVYVANNFALNPDRVIGFQSKRFFLLLILLRQFLFFSYHAIHFDLLFFVLFEYLYLFLFQLKELQSVSKSVFLDLSQA